MTPSRKSKHLRTRQGPLDRKEARTDPKQRPEQSNQEKIAWGFQLLDQGGSWGVKAMNQDWEIEILPKLRDFESMTWQEILSASGGRTRGNNSHSITVNKLSEDAKKRLEEINLDDVDSLFSLRLTGKRRLYGIREGRVLKLIWYDPEHKICPVYPN